MSSISRRRPYERCGTTGRLFLSTDWSATPLGPVDEWPTCIVDAVRLALACGFPLCVVIGCDPATARVVYNDAFTACLGDKHPAAMGRPAREAWPEIWDFCQWALQQVRHTGRCVTGKDIRFELERGERLQEVYETLSFSPIWDDRGDLRGWLLCAIDTTEAVVRARREHTLRVIADQLGGVRTEDEVYEQVAVALSPAVKTVAFALLYAVDASREQALLRAVMGLDAESPGAPREVALRGEAPCPWKIRDVVRSRALALVQPVDLPLSAIATLAGPPRLAAVLPVLGATREEAIGALVIGVPPARAFDDAYESFLRLVANEIGTAVVRVRRVEEERRRTEALAELDRAKTRFLTNVSHEFRTPLTLLLGPTEYLLGDAGEPLSATQRAMLESVRRNANRLLRYVTALLDFARTEDHRAAMVFEPTDLASLTAEIAGAFQPLATKAGLRLTIDCPPLGESLFVVRETWERIVLNLLSNALKFTFAGEIAVSLRLGPENAELTVRDTGTGIPADALPHLFERFYRVPRSRARTEEGLGIGLAMVKELVELHGGSIRASSAPGRGTTFTVEIPRGSAHLPADRTRLEAPAEAAHRDVARRAGEALAWLAESATSDVGSPAPEAPAPSAPGAAEVVPAGRVLVAEDNADMRDYLARLLRPAYDVEAVATGGAALASARAHRPDLVLSDVLMPELDGLELLAALRDDPALCDIPIVLLSARGGDDVMIDALGRGADDYLVKPFSARELRARVRTHIELARSRREAAESHLKDVFLGLASHELRTPLTCLKLNVQLCHRQLAATDPRLAARLAGLHRSIDRMTRLVAEMLSISAISAGKLALQKQPCDLVEMCRAAAAEQSQVTGRALTLDLPSQPVRAEVDEDRLGQVVSNLLSNAIKYSAADSPVTLSLRMVGREITVTVRDRGPGIPDEAKPHLFERFYRAPGVGVQTGSSVGLGLGLFISKGIVEQHAGRIWVESKPGEGSAFSFSVPIAA